MILIPIGIVYFAYASTDIPDANADVDSEESIVYWNDGETELHRFASIQREPVSLSQIPEHVLNAVIAAEDRTFWTNDGFDPVGIARAGWNAVRNREVTGGGSTITQQYVKNYYLTTEQTITRKIKELFISVKIDQERSKDAILEGYLNTIFWGRGTVHGIQTASQSYFGKDVGDLTIEEGIALAAFIRSPDLYDPTYGDDDERLAANTQRFAERFRFVAEGMVAIEALTQAQADQLQPPEVKPRDRSNSKGGKNGYLINEVERELTALGFNEQEINSGGLRVVTTYDQKVQQAAVDAVAEQYPVDEETGEPLDPELHVGLAGIDPETGAVLGFYGGEDFVERAFNDAFDAKLQPGSTAKPFGVAVALEQGISLKSRYFGLSEIEDPRLGDDQTVRNQGGAKPGAKSPDGKITLLEGLVRSTNTVFTDLTLQFDDRGYAVKDSLERAGIPLKHICGAGPDDDIEDVGCGNLQSNPEYRTLLGFFSTPVVELTEAYATLASGGIHNARHVVERVVDRSGQVRYEADSGGERKYDSDVVADTTYALTQVVEDSDGTAKVARDVGRPVAAKTGTNSEFTAAFAGFAPQLSAAVVYYKGDGTLVDENSLKTVPGFEGGFSGGNVPGKTWTAFMQKALDGEPIEPFPEPVNMGRDRTPSPSPTPTEPTPTAVPTTPGTCPDGTEGQYPSCVPITAEVEVPVLKGLSQAEAEQKLSEVGLKANVNRQGPRCDPEDCVVTDQDPEAGATVDEGSAVRITVEAPDDGLIEVPDVEGGEYEFEEADAILTQAGLVAVRVDEPVDCGSGLDNYVIVQSPGPGAEVEPDTEIRLTVGKEPDDCES